jgi:hypothetical protein
MDHDKSFPRPEFRPGQPLENGHTVNAAGDIVGPGRGSDESRNRATYVRTEQFRPRNPDGTGGERLYVQSGPRRRRNYYYVDHNSRVRRAEPRRREYATASYQRLDDNTVTSSNGTRLEHIGDWYQGEKVYAQVIRGEAKRIFSPTFHLQADGQLGPVPIPWTVFSLFACE